jgi:LPXTG-site transpeptidase (sortase) family protein
MKAYKKLALLGITLMVVGLGVGAPFAYFWSQRQLALAQPNAIVHVPAVAPQPTAKPSLIIGKPVRIQVPSLKIDLAVADGTYNEKTMAWSLSKDKAHYALPSMQPNNETGNTLIYGHYRPEVFARLHKITPGAEAIITTDNGHIFTYTLRDVKTVDPTDVGIFTYEGLPQLTIQTCTGAYMQDRQLFYFDLSSAR